MPLHAESISFAYTPASAVLRNVTAGFPSGQITALIGPNGAGKSTLLRILLGVLTPGSGRVMFEGAPLPSIPRRDLASRLAYIPQYSAVAFPFTVREVVGLGRYVSGTGAAAAADEAMRAAEIDDRAQETIGVLSAGQQQRVTVARALAQLGPAAGKGAALLADEPVSAMDPAHALHTMGIFRALAARGVAVVMVVHDIALVSAFATRVLVLAADGSALAEGPTIDVLTTENLARAFGVKFRVLRDPDDPASPGIPMPRADTTI